MTDLARLTHVIRTAVAGDFQRQCQSIAVVGCGFCEECEALLELFPESSLTLIDLDQGALETLRTRLAARSDRVRAVEADAAHLADSAPGPYDFALVRHPDINAQPAVWMAVLDAVCGQLQPFGLLMIINYSTAEAEFVRATLRRLSVREMPVDPAHLIPVALGGNDRYIMICKKY